MESLPEESISPESSKSAEAMAFEQARAEIFTYRAIGICYFSFILSAVLWVYWGGRLESLGKSLTFSMDAFLFGTVYALGVVFISWILGYSCRVFREFMGQMQDVLGELSWGKIFFAAVMSGVGEEFFFRGAMQPVWGLWTTTVLFALVHPPLTRKMIPWTFFAFLVGLGLGQLFLETGNLWAPIVAHFGINFLNFAFMKKVSITSKGLSWKKNGSY